MLIDTNFVDILLDDDILRNSLRDLVGLGAAEVLATHLVIDEILASGDKERRASLVHVLTWVGAKAILTPAFILDRSRLGMARLGDDETTLAAMPTWRVSSAKQRTH